MVKQQSLSLSKLSRTPRCSPLPGTQGKTASAVRARGLTDKDDFDKNIFDFRNAEVPDPVSYIQQSAVLVASAITLMTKLKSLATSS